MNSVSLLILRNLEMVSDEKDIIESASKGAVKAGLEYSEDKIKQLAQGFLNRNYAFIKDEETIKSVKEQSKNGELALFKDYISDKDCIVLFKCGLSLKKLDEQNKEEKLKKLQEVIKSKYKLEGLHFAYFVQNGLFTKYVINLIEKNICHKKSEIKEEIEYLYNNIKNCVAFIYNNENITKKSREIVNTIDAHKPNCFIISAKLSAVDKAKQISEIVIEEINNYEEEFITSKNKFISLHSRTINLE